MNLTARDRKIVVAVVPILVIVGYWFLLLAPKRDEAAKAGDELAKQEQRRDTARAAAQAAEATKATFAKDYAQLVKLGKAIPDQLDMPTVIVQLEAAAQGTGISFTRIAAGERAPAPASPAPGGASGAPQPGAPQPGAPQPPAAPGTGNGNQPAAAGGAQAQSAPGGAVESAGDAVNNANSNTTAGAQAAGGDGAAAPTAGGAAGAATAAGLESVPIELRFEGHFFRLADFFHRIKRFVHVADERIRIGGRLLSIESLTFKSEPEIFPRLKAELKATVYLSPEAEGETAGASPQGPGQPTPAAGSAPASQPPAPNPTATVTP